MGRCRNEVKHFVFNLGDTMAHFVDPRCADDILSCGGSAQAVGSMIDALVTFLEKAGLKLNASNTKALTTEAQPPSTLIMPANWNSKTAQVAWLPSINAQHGQSTTRYKLLFA